MHICLDAFVQRIQSEDGFWATHSVCAECCMMILWYLSYHKVQFSYLHIVLTHLWPLFRILLIIISWKQQWKSLSLMKRPNFFLVIQICFLIPTENWTHFSLFQSMLPRGISRESSPFSFLIYLWLRKKKKKSEHLQHYHVHLLTLGTC